MIKALKLNESRHEWLGNEGRWRIIKVLRLVVAVPIALFGAGVVLFNAIRLTNDHPGAETEITLILGCVVIALAFVAFLSSRA